MSKTKVEFQETLDSQDTYSAPLIQGRSNIPLSNVINIEELSVGDSVTILTLPNGSFYLNKNNTAPAVLIGEITLSHVLFDGLEVEVTDV